MVTFSVLAAALIIVGVAAPQVVYARDAGRYSEFVDAVNDRRSELAKTEAKVSSLGLLMRKQQDEATALIPRLNTVSQADPEMEILPAEQLAAVAAAAKEVEEAIPEKPTTVDPGALQLLDRTIEQHPDLVPVSWFSVESDEVAELAGIYAEVPEPLQVEKTVSQKALDAVKRELREADEVLEEERDRLDRRSHRSEELAAAMSSAAGIIDEVALEGPALAQAIAEANPDVFEQVEAMGARAQQLADAASSSEYLRLADGGLLLASEAPDPPADARPVQLEGVARASVVLTRLEAFVAAAAEVILEQRRIDEMFQLPLPVEPELPVDDSGAGAGAGGGGADGSDGGSGADGAGESGADPEADADAGADAEGDAAIEGVIEELG